MSKNYIVNCYTCQHNGQETCKGCNTLLVGENEPYENWQLREDLETKDQRIAELEQENESYQRLINDICNKHRVGSLKDLDEMYQATTESLYASREYLEELKSEKWGLEKALELAVEELDDAKDMLRECNKNELASLLNTSVDYFKGRGKEIENDRK